MQSLGLLKAVLLFSPSCFLLCLIDYDYTILLIWYQREIQKDWLNEKNDPSFLESFYRINRSSFNNPQTQLDGNQIGKQIDDCCHCCKQMSNPIPGTIDDLCESIDGKYRMQNRQ